MTLVLTGYGRPQAASMPPRTEMGIHAHFPLGVYILLRNSRRKRSTENPGQAILLPPPRQKIPPVLGKIEKKNKRECCDTALYFLIPGRSQERNSCSISPCIFRDNRKYQHLFYPRTGVRPQHNIQAELLYV